MGPKKDIKKQVKINISQNGSNLASKCTKKTAKYLHLHCIQWQQPQTLKKSDVAETNIQQPPKNDNYMYVCMYMHA